MSKKPKKPSKKRDEGEHGGEPQTSDSSGEIVRGVSDADNVTGSEDDDNGNFLGSEEVDDREGKRGLGVDGVKSDDTEPSRFEINNRMWAQWTYETDLITTRYRFFIIVNTSLLALLAYSATQSVLSNKVELIAYEIAVILLGQACCFTTHMSILAAIAAQKHTDTACRWLTKGFHQMYINRYVFKHGWADVQTIPIFVSAGWVLVSGHLYWQILPMIGGNVSLENHFFDSTIQQIFSVVSSHALIALFSVLIPLGTGIIHVVYYKKAKSVYKKHLTNLEKAYRDDEESGFSMTQKEVRDILFSPIDAVFNRSVSVGGVQESRYYARNAVPEGSDKTEGVDL